jgi:diaminopimelate epimerase
MTKLHLSKLQATGNDFLVWMPEPGAPALAAETVARLCDRHRGIGADGLMTLTPGVDGADATMLLQNADGGEAEMSGNGIRALAWVAVRAGLNRGDELVVDTGGGRRTLALDRAPNGELVRAEVVMGAVEIEETNFAVTVHKVEYRGDVANVGNPHFVTFVDDPATARVTTHGPIIEHDERFPQRANIEFARVDSRTAITARVWERGAGETQACGTGACAVATVAHARGLVDDQVTVTFPGGPLTVTVGDPVRLAGPVAHVFDVDIEIETA